jgi:guanine deaminase
MASRRPAVGYDDAFQYEDFTNVNSARRIKIEQFRPDLAEAGYRAWEIRADRDPY